MHRHLAVLGSPIAHSRSPQIHRAAYEGLGLQWHYEAIECEASGLQALLDSRGDEWLGFSVTMPLKEQAFRLSALHDTVSAETGVVNTLLRLIDKDGKPSWAGFNTDVAGLAAALEEVGLDCAHTVVLGAGATAMSAVYAAKMRGAQRVNVLARRLEAAEDLASRFSLDADGVQVTAHQIQSTKESVLAAATCVISTLPGRAAETTPVPEILHRVPLFDVAYDPWPTVLAERWRRASTPVFSGLGMLVHQAVLQVRTFVNGDPATKLANESSILREMRAAAERPM